MDAPFKDGVPYISRLEEQQARINASNRDNIADINLDTLDAEINEFVAETQWEIDEWVGKKGVRALPLSLSVVPRIDP